MHALVVNGTVEKYPYSIGQLRKDNPQTSFPKAPGDELLAAFNVYPVTRTERPDYSPITHDLREGSPERVNGVWTQVWIVEAAAPDEVLRRRAEQHEQIRVQRANAFRDEADPLFLKAQRDEADLTEWKAKVQEIRDRLPYPEE
jgi:hypothetical protein